MKKLGLVLSSVLLLIGSECFATNNPTLKDKNSFDIGIGSEPSTQSELCPSPGCGSLP